MKSQSIEHRPWLGFPIKGTKRTLYEEGIKGGLRVAIVGYSHYYTKKSEECDEFTIDIMERVVKGEMKENTFFPAIPKYFGFKGDKRYKDFWKRVLFFNFLPKCIGKKSEKYKKGAPPMIERGTKRFEEILKEYRPDCVFVFTKKGWKDCPETIELKDGRSCISHPSGFEWGRYYWNGHKITAFGLCHPQFANLKAIDMPKAIRHALRIHKSFSK